MLMSLPVAVTELLGKELDKISGAVCELGSLSICARSLETGPETPL